MSTIKPLEIYGLIADDLLLVENELSGYLCCENRTLGPLNDHILSLSGKRLRPALVLLVAKMFGYKDKARIHLSTSIELVHTATLLHDDVIDEAKMRRFKESVNLRWGNKTAILTGDAIFARAISILANHTQGEVLSLVARSVEEVATGEIEQMIRSYDLNLTEAEYLGILSKKTGSLISACTGGMAILASSCAKEIAALKQYGLKFGLGFQIIDDCLDLMGTEEEIGKETLNDKKQGRLTLPFIELKRRLPKIDPFDMNREEVKKLAIEHGALEYALKKAKLYLDEAKGELELFPASIYCQALREIADYVGRRMGA
ncbi:polyprenyl synthetase family protein [bacterium]|nr:polyprenyl synthetase family protein [bacterium]MBU1613821.1 polyprenyl synthetase family protein [bacterium]